MNAKRWVAALLGGLLGLPLGLPLGFPQGLSTASAQSPPLSPPLPTIDGNPGVRPGAAPPVTLPSGSLPSGAMPPHESFAPMPGVVSGAARPESVVIPSVMSPESGYDVPGVSNWIRRDPKCCNGPVGKHSEIGMELYTRLGASLSIGDGPLMSRNTGAGFTAQIGARTLFFNQAYTRAWVVDTSISNTRNSGVQFGDEIPYKTIINATPPINFDSTVTVRDYNRTFVNLGVGHDWFLHPALGQPAGWRFSIDGGGGWGTSRVNLNELTHRGDVVGRAYTGAMANYEFGCWHSIVNIGFRTEYSYTWSDVFRRESDLSEINLLMNFGVRY